MAARGRGRNHTASKTSPPYFRTHTEAVALCSLLTKDARGRAGRERGASTGWAVSVSLPSSPPASPHHNGLGRRKGLIAAEAERRREDGRQFERQWLDSCVCCGIFKRINAGSNHPAMPDLFLAQAGHCSISAAAGPRGVDSNANEFSLLLPPTLPSHPTGGELDRERRGAQGQQHWSRLG